MICSLLYSKDNLDFKHFSHFSHYFYRSMKKIIIGSYFWGAKLNFHEMDIQIYMFSYRNLKNYKLHFSICRGGDGTILTGLTQMQFRTSIPLKYPEPSAPLRKMHFFGQNSPLPHIPQKKCSLSKNVLSHA